MLDALLDMLVPQRCAGCGTLGVALCANCVVAITWRPVIRDTVPGIRRVTALGAYDGVLRRAILALKYSNATAVGEALGALLGQRLEGAGNVLVPVPLHPSRLRKRGYNQAETLARGVLRGWSSEDRAPPRLAADALIRAHPTVPQSGLDHDARQANVGAAFCAGSRVLEIVDRRVVLIDDVLTTGATLRACAAVLKRHGAAAVDACCAAIKL
jgi:ComF family protein